MQRCDTRAVLAACAILLTPSLLNAQVKRVQLSDIPRNQREAITLSQKDAERANCAIIYNPKVPPFVSYINPAALQVLLENERAMPAGKYILYSVRVDTAGVATSNMFETNMKSADADRISSAVTSTLVG